VLLRSVINLGRFSGFGGHDSGDIAMVIGLVALIFSMAGLGIAAVGSGSSCPGGSIASSTPSPCWTQVQSGFFSCPIRSPASICPATITFSPSYSIKPFCCNPTWNGSVSHPAGNTHISVPETMYEYFQSNNETWWRNVPTTETELYGFSNQRLLFPNQAGITTTGISGQFCMDFADEPDNSSATFTVQYSTDQSTWVTMGDSFFNVTASQTTDLLGCGVQESIPLSTSSAYYFRVVGSDPNPGSNYGIGTIELLITEILSISTGIANTCWIQTNSITTTTASVEVVCDFSITATFTVNWWAGIPG
jgi:hypothetical protein